MSFVGLKNHSIKTATQDVEFGLSTIDVGELRDSSTGKMDKDVLITNLALKVSDSLKDHEHETIINYSFLDKEGNVTNDEEKIESVQFQVQLLSEKGRVVASSQERIELNY